MRKKLYVGCGTKKLAGYINCDLSRKYDPDAVIDVCRLSTKFKENSIDEILTEHTIEHVPDFTRTMFEMWKVLKKGGKLRIVVPYAGLTSSFHPFHLHNFSYNSFFPFKKGDRHDDYYNFHFSEVRVKLYFSKAMRWFSRFANKYSGVYENSFLSRFFPANEVHVEMIK